MRSANITQQRYEQIKNLLRGPLLIRHFDMQNGSLFLKEEPAQTLAMAIVIDFEKQETPTKGKKCR